MTNAEHAIENAVCAIERTSDKKDISLDELYKKWKETDINLKYIKSDPSEIWEMAMWVYYNYHESVLCNIDSLTEQPQDNQCNYWIENEFDWMCPNCNHNFEESTRYCPDCGKKLYVKDE